MMLPMVGGLMLVSACGMGYRGTTVSVAADLGQVRAALEAASGRCRATVEAAMNA